MQLATSAPAEVASILKTVPADRVGFEAGHLTYDLVQAYRRKMPRGRRLVPTNRLLDDLRLAALDLLYATGFRVPTRA